MKKKLFALIFCCVVLTACGDSDDFSFSTDNNSTFSVGGTVTGLSGDVTLTNNGGDELTLSADGVFEFGTEVADGADYVVAVSVQPTFQTCTVNNGSGTMTGSPIDDVTVICANNSFPVGGTVTGLSGDVTLTNNGGDELTLSADGAFDFATEVADGADYAVAVSEQPAFQTCTVNNGSGTMAGSAIDNVSVSCSTNSFTVGGTVTGLSGNVTLTNNGGDALTISTDGAFEFATEVADGADYTVAVSTQPDFQICTVDSDSGTLSGSAITDVSINCFTMPIIERVSLDSAGTQGNGRSGASSMSGDSRFVAFYSSASNLVAGDTNGRDDVFIHDRTTGETVLISINIDNVIADGNSRYPSISDDGRYVVFESSATNLVAGEVDANGDLDVYLCDNETGEITRISEAPDGSDGDSESYNPRISADGRYVVYQSFATNLVSSDTNGQADIFLYEIATGNTTIASVASDGTQPTRGSQDANISGDGRYVVFVSRADDLVTPDTNGITDIFRHDTVTGETSLVSVATDGTKAIGVSYYARPGISHDGRYVAFASGATNLDQVLADTNNLPDIYYHDTLTGETTRISVDSGGNQANGTGSTNPVMSEDGRFVAFVSTATNLVVGDTNNRQDIFVHDTSTGETSRVSLDATDTQVTDGNSSRPAISSDGRYISFESSSVQFVTGDTNFQFDVFVRER